MRTLLVIFMLLIFTGIAHADCWYNGGSYPTGSIVNGYVCAPDGTWKSQNGYKEIWTDLLGLDMKK